MATRQPRLAATFAEIRRYRQLLLMLLAYWLWCAALSRVELNRANVFTFLVPLFGLAIGVLWFGEQLEGPQLVGIGLTVGGVALASGRKQLNA